MKCLKLSAEIIDLDTHQHFLELRFHRQFGPRGRIRVPNAERRNFRLVLRELDNSGALLPASRKEALKLVELVLSDAAPRVRHSTSRVGWVDGDSFVLPSRTVGGRAKSLHHSPNSSVLSTTWSKSGSLEAWRDGLSEPCRRSSYLLFATAVPFAGPLLRLRGETEGAFFNLTGESSTGKTLASRVAQSIITRAHKTDLIPASLTDRALEEIAFGHNDLAVVIDELGNMKGNEQTRREKFRTRAYELSGGRGTVRSKSVHQNLPSLEWALFGITSWESPLNELARARGEMVRFIDVTIPSRVDAGIFDLIEDSRDGRPIAAKDLALAVENTIVGNYGVAIEPYLKRLVDDRTSAAAAVEETVGAFVHLNCRDGDPWDVRLATKFGLVAAGARLAADWGIAPWSVEQAEAAIQVSYEAALSGTITPEEVFDGFLRKVRKAVSDKKHFPVVEEKTAFSGKSKKKAWGVTRHHRNQGVIVALRRRRFERLCGSANRRAVIISKLIESGILWAPQKNTPTAQMTVKGLFKSQRSRFYCLRKEELRRAWAKPKGHLGET
ncbi:MAG: DUF927 domain-containing protein [Phycisphaeraceae bacterium]